ncbi:MAG: alpha/beta fold hydrolase [Myxococcaceae bacterium]|nr:alpha/beta fold hydrolase [Myxococcaceae bacterium]
MKSFFFGTAKNLYGTLHEPAGKPKDLGVVLCYPGPQEYHMTYWAFRRLAQQLARGGVTTLRFDYACTGDSSGDVTDGRLAQWADDITTAAAELKALSGVRKLAVVGMRLGAALATRAVAKGLKVSELVLWEPVVSGPKYLEQLEDLDAREARRLLHRVAGVRIELGGYRFSSGQRDELMGLDTANDVPRLAQRVVFACPPEDQPKLEPLRERWAKEGVTCEFNVTHDAASVTATEDRDAAVMYTATLFALTEQLAGARA